MQIRQLLPFPTNYQISELTSWARNPLDKSDLSTREDTPTYTQPPPPPPPPPTILKTLPLPLIQRLRNLPILELIYNQKRGVNRICSN